MFESVVGEDVFRLSLQSFIKHHFYDNAISADFARSIGRFEIISKHFFWVTKKIFIEQ